MCTIFLKQYDHNTRLEVLIRDLELTKKKFNESFSNFLTRFMNKAGLMKNKLVEKDQVRMIVRNMSPNLVERLLFNNPGVSQIQPTPIQSPRPSDPKRPP